MKPSDSSDEGHGLMGGLREDSLRHAVAQILPPAAERSESGVIAAPSSEHSKLPDDEEQTRVGPGGTPLAGEQQLELARRIRHAMGQTLPLGTPVPASAVPASRSVYARTMILGGRQLPGLVPSEPPVMAPTRSTARFDAVGPETLREEAQRLAALRTEARRAEAMRPEMVTPVALSPLPPQAFPPSSGGAAPATPAEAEGPDSAAPAEGPDSAALRASLVRPVGFPTEPPPRRSRRPPAPGDAFADDVRRDALVEADHEAFALDRPLTVPPGGLPDAPQPGEGATGVRTPPLSTGLILPPPPQPGDFELTSSPSSLPPAPRPPEAVRAFAASRVAPRVPAPPLLSDMPSANPFEGFEKPRETLLQRSLIVLVVALAVVGVFALAALAFGFLGFGKGW